MKVIIAGSRTVTDFRFVYQAANESGFEITEVVSGGAPGVDTLGEEFAADLDVPLKVFPAEWEKLGKSAGPIRNRHMAEYADALIAIWDGESRGTKNMIATMERLGKPAFVLNLSDGGTD